MPRDSYFEQLRREGRPVPSYRCAQEGCDKATPAHAWTYKSKTGKGWFHQQDGQSWCPEHIPEWVEGWREKRDRGGQKYKRKPLKPYIITAVQWKGDNLDEVSRFVGKPLETILPEDTATPGEQGPLLCLPASVAIIALPVGYWLLRDPKDETERVRTCPEDVFEYTWQLTT